MLAGSAECGEPGVTVATADLVYVWHTHEVHAYEMHVHMMHTHEVHAGEVHVDEVSFWALSGNGTWPY